MPCMFASGYLSDCVSIRLRTREGSAIAWAKGELCGWRSMISNQRAGELWRRYDSRDYSVGDPAAVFTVSRATVHRKSRRNLRSCSATSVIVPWRLGTRCGVETL